MSLPRTWHEKHAEQRTVGERIADTVATGMGSWKFIIGQTVFVAVWMVFNVVAYVTHWDPFPFILLNLIFSTQAAYAAPIIMMSQNRASDRDRVQAEHDYAVNRETHARVDELAAQVASLIETLKEKP